MILGIHLINDLSCRLNIILLQFWNFDWPKIPTNSLGGYGKGGTDTERGTHTHAKNVKLASVYAIAWILWRIDTIIYLYGVEKLHVGPAPATYIYISLFSHTCKGISRFVGSNIFFTRGKQNMEIL